MILQRFHDVGYVLADPVKRKTDEPRLLHGENTDTITVGHPHFETAHISRTQYQAEQLRKGIAAKRIDRGGGYHDAVRPMEVHLLQAVLRLHNLSRDDLTQIHALAAIERAAEQAYAGQQLSEYEKNLVVKTAGSKVDVQQAFAKANTGYFVLMYEFGRVEFMQRKRTDELDVFVEGDYYRGTEAESEFEKKWHADIRFATRFTKITGMADYLPKDYPASFFTDLHVAEVSYRLVKLDQKQSRNDIFEAALKVLPESSRRAFETLTPKS